jgi:hypothetical protein
MPAMEFHPITAARIKAFIDDLALVSAKHGLVLCGDPEPMRCREIDSRFGGYEPSPTQVYSARPGQQIPIYTYAAGTQPIGAIYSLDVSELTAHERIRLTREGRL